MKIIFFLFEIIGKLFLNNLNRHETARISQKNENNYSFYSEGNYCLALNVSILLKSVFNKETLAKLISKLISH